MKTDHNSLNVWYTKLLLTDGRDMFQSVQIRKKTVRYDVSKKELIMTKRSIWRLGLFRVVHYSLDLKKGVL